MLVVALFLFGLIFGSFSGATAWRIHKRMEAEEAGKSVAKKYSISQGRSMCEHCGHELAAIDLVPLFSWLSQLGRCRYCHVWIGWELPVIELVTGALFAVSYIVMQPTSLGAWVHFGFWLYLVVSLMILAISDIKWMLLPDVVLLPALAVAAAYALGLAVTSPDGWWLLASGALAGGVFLAMASLSGGRWMGGGDVKLAALMGVVLGPWPTILAMLVGFNSAAIVGLTLIATGRRKRQDMIPFGPFLIAGLIVAALWGMVLVNWYFRQSGLVTAA